MYGPTIRKVRKSKGIMLKEVYLGIVSKSFYIEFEKGKYNIEMSKFKNILDILTLTFEEFLYIHEGYKLAQVNNLNEKISIDYTNWDLLSLNTIYKEYKDSRFVRERFLASKAYALIYITEDNANFMSEKPLSELKTYLISLKEWTLEDIRDYISISSIFDVVVSKELFQRACNSLKKYQSYEADLYNTLCIELFMGHIQTLLINQQIDEASETLQLMEKITHKNTTFGLNIFVKCYKLILSFYTENDQGEKTNNFLNALDVINFEEKQQIKSLIFLHKSLSEGKTLDSLYSPSIYYSDYLKKNNYRKE